MGTLLTVSNRVNFPFETMSRAKRKLPNRSAVDVDVTYNACHSLVHFPWSQSSRLHRVSREDHNYVPRGSKSNYLYFQTARRDKDFNIRLFIFQRNRCAFGKQLKKKKCSNIL